MSTTGALPTLPPSMPRFSQHGGRRLCAWFLRRCGWQLRGEFPDLPRLVLIAAPHSSWWDGFWGLVFKVALGADIAFLGKAELFHGPLGWLLRKLGGIPVDRAAAHGVVEEMTRHFSARGQLWLCMAPEGTRKRVTQWRSGFWHIARATGVPIFPVAFDYPSRSIVLGPPFQTSADPDADLARLRAWYAPFHGKHHGVSAP